MNKLTLTLDASQITQYLTCPEAWNLRYKENLIKADLITKALDKGTIVHHLFDIYYNLRALNPLENYNIHAEATIELFRKNVLQSLKYNKDEVDIEFLIKRFGQYIFKWAATNNDFKPLISDGKPAVEVGFSEILYEDEKYIFIVEGRLDLLHVINNTIVWVDHKSQEREINLYKFKPQFLTYALITGLPGMINYVGLQKELKPTSLRRSEIIIVPQWKLEKWRTKLIDIFTEISTSLKYNCAFEEKDESCSGAFDSHPCQYTMICESHSVEIKNQIKKFKFIQIEPWKPW